jgi:hypothetical protein
MSAVRRLRWVVAGLSLQRPGFASRSVHVGFVVDKVALRQVFLRVLRISLSVSFHRGCLYSYMSPGGRTVGTLVAAVQRHDQQQQQLRVNGTRLSTSERHQSSLQVT